MPKKLTIYDKETGEAIERFAVTAREAVDRDPDRFSLKPWKQSQVDAAKKAKDTAKPKPGRTTSGPKKVEPVGRENTGAAPPDESKEAADKDEK